MINMSPTSDDYLHILSPVNANPPTCQQSQQNDQTQLNNYQTFEDNPPNSQ